MVKSAKECLFDMVSEGMVTEVVNEVAGLVYMDENTSIEITIRDRVDESQVVIINVFKEPLSSDIEFDVHEYLGKIKKYFDSKTQYIIRHNIVEDVEFFDGDEKRDVNELFTNEVVDGGQIEINLGDMFNSDGVNVNIPAEALIPEGKEANDVDAEGNPRYNPKKDTSEELLNKFGEDDYLANSGNPEDPMDFSNFNPLYDTYSDIVNSFDWSKPYHDKDAEVVTPEEIIERQKASGERENDDAVLPEVDNRTLSDLEQELEDLANPKEEENEEDKSDEGASSTSADSNDTEESNPAPLSKKEEMEQLQKRLAELNNKTLEEEFDEALDEYDIQTVSTKEFGEIAEVITRKFITGSHFAKETKYEELIKEVADKYGFDEKDVLDSRKYGEFKPMEHPDMFERPLNQAINETVSHAASNKIAKDDDSLKEMIKEKMKDLLKRNYMHTDDAGLDECVDYALESEAWQLIPDLEETDLPEDIQEMFDSAVHIPFELMGELVEEVEVKVEEEPEIIETKEEFEIHMDEMIGELLEMVFDDEDDDDDFSLDDFAL